MQWSVERSIDVITGTRIFYPRMVPCGEVSLCVGTAKTGLHDYISSLSIECRRNGQSIRVELCYNVERRVDFNDPGEIRLLIISVGLWLKEGAGGSHVN